METEKRVITHLKHSGCKTTIKKNRSEVNGLENVISIQRILYSPKVKVQFLQFVVVALITLVSPVITFAQLPNLGTSETFVIFTTAGGVDNTGTSNLTGDIGTDDGAITGFGAPTVVNGNTENANAVTAQCAIDVQAAYDELFAVTPTVVGHAPAFGSEETLPVGVYFIGAAGSVAGNLTLDAAGDPDAIFIFQFGGAFTTGASTTVNLINGASACNVFWIAEGAISMAAITDMKGTLISNNGAISMGAGGTLEGRMLSTAGAASVYDVSITKPSCAITYLSVSMLSFTGYCDNQNIVLEWTTATEINNDFFSLERSSDAFYWQIVGTTNGAGNSNTLINYSFTDPNPSTLVAYYRLKQTDFDGAFKYSEIISYTNCEEGLGEFDVYPNPTQGPLNFFVDVATKELMSMSIYNSVGILIYHSSQLPSMIDLSNEPMGVYFVSIQSANQLITRKFRIIK